MFVLRLLGLLVVITVGAGAILFLVTRDTKYLQLAWWVFRADIGIALVFFIFLALERFVFIPL